VPQARAQRGYNWKANFHVVSLNRGNVAPFGTVRKNAHVFSQYFSQFGAFRFGDRFGIRLRPLQIAEIHIREIQKTPVAWALLRILSSKNKWERDSRKWEARRNKWEDSQYLNVPANDRANASATLRANRVERPLAANKVILL
jgi:hypothetical protein